MYIGIKYMVLYAGTSIATIDTIIIYKIIYYNSLPAHFSSAAGVMIK